MSKWSKKDTSRETGESIKKVSKAFHDAREHAMSAGELPERAISKIKKLFLGKK